MFDVTNPVSAVSAQRSFVFQLIDLGRQTLTWGLHLFHLRRRRYFLQKPFNRGSAGLRIFALIQQEEL
jgi:hypothetical protein